MPKDSTTHIISPEGKLLIDTAAEIYSRLKDAVAKYSVVMIKWDAIEDLDMPILQLFYSARKEAVSKGKELHFVGSIQDRVISRLSGCGFVKHLPISGEDLEACLVDF